MNTDMSRMHDILRMDGHKGKWRVRSAGGSTSDRLDLADLRNMAASNLLSAYDQISEDGYSWIRAHELADLKMEWLIKEGGNEPIGPFNILAIPHLLVSKNISKHARLINKTTGKDLDMAEVLRSSMDTISKTGTVFDKRGAIGSAKDHLQPELFPHLQAGTSPVQPVKKKAPARHNTETAGEDRGENTKLNTECRSLREQIGKTEAENTRLKNAGDRLSLKISELSERINRLTEQLRDEQEKSKSLSRELAGARDETLSRRTEDSGEIQKLKADLKSRTDEASALAVKLNSLSASAEQQKSETEKAVKKLREAEALVEVTVRERDKTLEKQTDLVTGLRKKLRSAEAQSSLLEKKLSQQQEEYAGREAEIRKKTGEQETAFESAEKTIRDLREQLKTESAQREKLSAKNSEMQTSLTRQVQELKEALTEQSARASELAKSAGEKDDLVKNLNARIQNLSSQLERITSERTSLTEQVSVLTSSRNELEKSWKEKESALSARIRAMSDDITAISAGRITLETQLRDQAENDKLANESREREILMEKDVARLMKKNEALSAKLQEVSARAERTEESLAKAKEKYEQVSAEASKTGALTKECSSLHEKLFSAEKRSSAFEEEISVLKKQNQALARTSAEIEKAKKSLVLRFEDVRKEQGTFSENLEKEHKQLADSLASANAELAEKKKELDALRHEIGKHDGMIRDMEKSVRDGAERERKHLATIRELKAKLEGEERGKLLLSSSERILSSFPSVRRASAILFVTIVCSLLAFAIGYRKRGTNEENTVRKYAEPQNQDRVGKRVEPSEPAKPPATRIKPSAPAPSWPEINLPDVTTDRKNGKLVITFKQGVFVSMAKMTEDSSFLLHKIADLIRPHINSFHIEIQGHTDSLPVSSQTSFRGNLDLAQARADTVKEFLAEKCGIPASSMTSIGKSEQNAPFPNTDAESRKKNRTAVLIISRKTAGN